jgi:hypothetical protein
MLWTGSVMSPYSGDYLPREGIGAHGGNDADHGGPSVNSFCFFVKHGKSEIFFLVGENHAVAGGVCYTGKHPTIIHLLIIEE